MRSNATFRHLYGRIAAGVLVAMCLALSGCGGNEGSAGPYKGGLDARQAEQDAKNEYAKTFGRMLATMEDPQAPPVEKSINMARRNDLIANARRWDAALAVIQSATPPKDAKAAHDQLVKAMTELSDWNQRIAAAAPSRAKTRRVAKQARNSAAAKQFAEAVVKLEQLGYGGSEQPLDEAGSPVE
jgi:hypothetical protein